MEEINNYYTEKLNALIADSSLKFTSSDRTDDLSARYLEVYEMFKDKLDDLPSGFTKSIFGLIFSNYNQDEKHILLINKVEYKNFKHNFKFKLKSLKKVRRTMIKEKRLLKKDSKKFVKKQKRKEFIKSIKSKIFKKKTNKSEIKPGQ